MAETHRRGSPCRSCPSTMRRVRLCPGTRPSRPGLCGRCPHGRLEGRAVFHAGPTAFCTGQCFALGDCPVHCRTFSSTPGLCPRHPPQVQMSPKCPGGNEMDPGEKQHLTASVAAVTECQTCWCKMTQRLVLVPGPEGWRDGFLAEAPAENPPLVAFRLERSSRLLSPHAKPAQHLLPLASRLRVGGTPAVALAPLTSRAASPAQNRHPRHPSP